MQDLIFYHNFVQKSKTSSVNYKPLALTEAPVSAHQGICGSGEIRNAQAVIIEIPQTVIYMTTGMMCDTYES
jgi:hypothetical protein